MHLFHYHYEVQHQFVQYEKGWSIMGWMVDIQISMTIFETLNKGLSATRSFVVMRQQGSFLQ